MNATTILAPFPPTRLPHPSTIGKAPDTNTPLRTTITILTVTTTAGRTRFLAKALKPNRRSYLVAGWAPEHTSQPPAPGNKIQIECRGNPTDNPHLIAADQFTEWVTVWKANLS